MTAIFSTHKRVEFVDTDAAGIAHFSAFMLYMEQAEHELLRHLGLSVMTKDAEGKISWPRVSVRCDFQSSAKFEDILTVEVRILRLGEKSITYGFRFFEEGRAVATGETTAVCCRIVHEQPPKSMAVPPAMAEKLRAYLDICEHAGLVM
ncbi:MAG: acyl-CoA thioesterase [Planctomycetaceae bacterium]